MVIDTKTVLKNFDGKPLTATTTIYSRPIKNADGSPVFVNGAPLFESEEEPITVAFVIERSLIGVAPKNAQGKEGMGEDIRRYQFAGRVHAAAIKDDSVIEITTTEAAWLMEMAYECFKQGMWNRMVFGAFSDIIEKG